MEKQLQTFYAKIKVSTFLILVIISNALNGQILFDNGPIFNSPGTGAGGANESVLYTTTFAMGTIGFGQQSTAFNRVADDFINTSCAWKIDSIVFFGYQTNSTTTSTFTAVNFRIWNGVPDAPGSSVVFGDTTTNRLTRTVWSGTYRITETTTGNTARPIMRNVCAIPGGVTLSADTFWIDWSSSGSLASGPWQPARTPVGLSVTGNGRQRTGSTWNNAVDGGTGNPAQGFPFIIYGTAVQKVNAGIDQVTCAGIAVSLTASNATTYGWSNGNSGATISVSPNSTTDYVVTGTDASSGCISIDTVRVSVNPLPTVGASATNDTLCSGQPTTLTGSGAATYTWNNGISNGIAFSPTSTLTYTVTGTDTNGCFNTATQTVTVNALPTVTTTTPAAICSGSNTSLSANATVPIVSNGIYCQPTYSTGTTFGDYISRVQLNTLLVNSLGSASPFYTLFPDTGSATTTLVAGVTDTIRLRAGTFTVNDFAAWIDYNQNDTFEVSEKLGQILNQGASPAEGKIGFTVPTTAFNGKTRLRVRELDGAANISIDPCLVQSQYGEVEDYTITITGGLNNNSNNGITYAWSPSTFLSSTSVSNPSVTGATSTTTYTVTATSSFGCVDTANVTLLVNALPVVTANASSPAVCIGGTVTLTGGGAATYVWDNGVNDGVAFVPSSTINYTVTGTDANTCSNTATVTVTVNALPIVTANASTNTICAGDNVTLTGGGATTYVWDNGATNGVAISPATTTTFTVTGTDANTCSNTATVTVTVNPNPVASLTAPVSTPCAGTPITLTGLPAGGTYSVASGSPSALTGNVFNATTTGSYSIAYSSTNGFGCTDTAQFTFAVNCVLGLDKTISNAASFSIFPNPNNGLFTINSSIEVDGTVELSNELGQVVYRSKMNGLAKSIEVQNITSGIYHLRIINGNQILSKTLSIKQ